MGLNAKAKALLEDIIEESALKMRKGAFDLRASDAINAAKLLLSLVDADKTPDVSISSVPIVVVVDKQEYNEAVKKSQEEQNIQEIKINMNEEDTTQESNVNFELKDDENDFALLCGIFFVHIRC